MRSAILVLVLAGCLATTSKQDLAHVSARGKDYPIVTTAPGVWAVLAEKRLHRCPEATVASCQAAIDRALPPLPARKPAIATAGTPPAPGVAAAKAP